MPGKTITLEYAGTCKECGTALHPGDRARYYGRGRVYGIRCHPQSANPRTQKGRGLTLCLRDATREAYALEYGQVSS